MVFNDIPISAAWIGLVISALITVFFGFKGAQAHGAGKLNNILTSIGGGSFITMILTRIKKAIWVVLCLFFGFITLMFYVRIFP